MNAKLILALGAMVALAYFAAPLLARGFSEPHPDIVPVIRALTLFLFFEGLSTVPRVYFEGELKIGRAVAPEVTRNLFMAVTSVSLAVAGFGIWSVVIAHIGSAGLYALMLWWRAWGEMPLLFQRGEKYTWLVWTSQSHRPSFAPRTARAKRSSLCRRASSVRLRPVMSVEMPATA